LKPRILFVTGRLAEAPLRAQLASLTPALGFEADVAVLGISVAALMHADWVARKLTVPERVDRVLLPGWCQGDLSALERKFGKPFALGPKDLHDLPEYFAGGQRPRPDLAQYDIEILAEINHAPRLPERALLLEAKRLGDQGADVIDLGCIPGESWRDAGLATSRLVNEGFRVSIDSFDRGEVEAAVSAGAELVLSCNASNRTWLSQLPVELVAVPDEPADFESLAATVALLDQAGARFRIDPILEPIGFGFAASLERYFAARRRWPSAAMMMGVGNLTELTEVDSAGLNLLLAAVCQELKINSVLTTQVAHWCQTAVRELDLARRVVRYAVAHKSLPKQIGGGLLLLRDGKPRTRGPEELEQLARRLRDANYRVFAEHGRLHVMNRQGYLQGWDPFELLEQLEPLEPAHAFYLGYELAKASIALALGKEYRQDEALNWGFLTVNERHRKQQTDDAAGEVPNSPSS
jgi:dihydropteroate synthase-like protein